MPSRRRRRRCAARLLAAGGVAVVLVVTGSDTPSRTSGAVANEPSTSPATVPWPAGSTYTVLQTNLCLSGSAGCYVKVAYPGAVNEAIARIREVRPDAVTVNEACGRDVARIARRTGYHASFSAVIAWRATLPCIRPGGRGRFGVAVLTKAAIGGTDSRAFRRQAGPESRRWLCAATRERVDVCTAHLATRSLVEATGNDAQCAELAALLARRAAARTTIFGGDVNRRRGCAPHGAWARTDRSGDQAAGLQHVYGSGALRAPTVKVLPTTHTDHDVLLVRARLGARR